MVTAHGAVGHLCRTRSGLDSVDIIGNSMGGGVGINYAIRQPAKVRRLVTIGGIGNEHLHARAGAKASGSLQEFTENPTRPAAGRLAALDGVRPGAGDR